MVTSSKSNRHRPAITPRSDSDKKLDGYVCFRSFRTHSAQSAAAQSTLEGVKERQDRHLDTHTHTQVIFGITAKQVSACVSASQLVTVKYSCWPF